MEQAIKPGILPLYRKVRQLDNQQISNDEQSIGILAETSGWQVLKEYIEEQINSLRNLPSVDEKSTMEEIGFKFLVADLTCYKLQSIIDRVESIKKYFDDKKEQETKEKKVKK